VVIKLLFPKEGLLYGDCHSPSLPTFSVAAIRCRLPCNPELGCAAIAEFQVVRLTFVVAPILIAADKTSRKSAESAVRSVLRCQKIYEIGRVGAYFDHFWLNRKRRKTRWRRELELNRRANRHFEAIAL
jgi:hypothetical protein